jgi:hypothetical protein
MNEYFRLFSLISLWFMGILHHRKAIMREKMIRDTGCQRRLFFSDSTCPEKRGNFYIQDVANTHIL